MVGRFHIFPVKHKGDTMNTVQTRKVTLSNRKLNNIGKDYRDTFLGLNAVFTSFNGERTVGTITHFTDNRFPCVTFADGGWARLDLTIELV